MISCALTIAGTDPSGGAGIQADLKTFQELGVYGMSVVTSVVAQNTTGVQGVHHMPASFLTEQVRSVRDDMPIHAVKSGMIPTVDMMRAVADQVEHMDAPYVIDPVMVAQSGDELIEESAMEMWKERLIPLATIITPNIPEAEKIIGTSIHSVEDMREAAEHICTVLGASAALIKGGHRDGEALDVLYDGSEWEVFTAERIDTANTHGTGCTYSAAITACLSQGHSLFDSVRISKEYVTAAIRESFSLGHGSGPTNHFAWRKERSI
ncbi:bifunctional hydroxymethylpyrimidine kinase/phosphomethylpyrimidine kinase [Halobacillus salinus]|uniref:bifunctional hydroxymethylpyrimidine kinase/phosphomethylpyrimidine kinase n=1 Tax=Halobacillus salinus TaxID=192814 RepID=UPI0009A61883|nr:bifunctional hydroxymethylpyrimidine kinase/phosphomethylpyrimidine kinase [Halobacillus salinus]